MQLCCGMYVCTDERTDRHTYRHTYIHTVHMYISSIRAKRSRAEHHLDTHGLFQGSVLFTGLFELARESCCLLIVLQERPRAPAVKAVANPLRQISCYTMEYLVWHLEG